jgi:hypothetical protein
MKIIGKLLLVWIAGIGLSACVPTVRTYVDPQYRHASYDTIQRSSSPVPVNVVTHFEFNGAAKPGADGELRRDVEEVLRASGVFIPTNGDQAKGVISVVANNIGDVGSARAQGFRTGLTFGAVGSRVVDAYAFDVSYQVDGTTQYRHTYDHRLVTTVGNASGPAGAMPTTLDDGFRQVVEDVMLNFLQDWQSKGIADNR